jgi:hypothetical protein
MNQSQTNQLNMCNATLQWLNDNAVTYSNNAIITGVVLAIKNNVGALNILDQTQKNSTKPLTQTKTQAKKIMTDLAMSHANAGVAYGTANNNTALASTCKIAKKALSKAKDTDADDYCQNIHDAVAPFIANMAIYAVNATTLGLLTTAINTFSGLIGKPKSKQAVSVSATQSIVLQFKAIKSQFKDSLDPLLKTQLTSALFLAYKTARKVINSGTHHDYILSGTVYNGNTPLIGAIVTIKNTKKKSTTKANGKYKFTGLTAGSYTITASATGFAAQSKTAAINTPQNIVTDFMMTA